MAYDRLEVVLISLCLPKFHPAETP